MSLHINIEDLLSARTVESDRIEYKEGWNPDAIYRTICGFANDIDNTGGGYILIGIEEENGVAKRPVKGVATTQLAEIQRKMIGFNNLVEPAYHAKLFVEVADGKQAGDQARDQARSIVGSVDRDKIVEIAIEIRRYVQENMKKILLFCYNPRQRKEILQEIRLSNKVKNYNAYVLPLVILDWIAMTLPDKPTSPNQQYRSTLKGRIVTEILNYTGHGG